MILTDPALRADWQAELELKQWRQAGEQSLVISKRVE